MKTNASNQQGASQSPIEKESPSVEDLPKAVSVAGIQVTSISRDTRD